MSTLFPTSWSEFINSLQFTGKRPIYDPQGRYIGYSSPGRDIDLCRGVANIEPQGYTVPASQWHIKSSNPLRSVIGGIEPVSNRCIREGFTPSWSTPTTRGVNIPDPRGGGGNVTLERPGPYPLAETAQQAGTNPNALLPDLSLPGPGWVPLAIGGGLLAAILLLRR